MSICDFCSDIKPIWRLECATFQIPDGSAVSLGGWYACEACADLIMAGKWNGLATRAVERTTSGRLLTEMVGKKDAEREVMRLHGEFRRRYTGEAKRI